MHAQGRTNTGPAIAAQITRFEHQVLEEAAARGETLRPDEVARRARWAQKSYLTVLALRASRAKSAKRDATEVHSPVASVVEVDRGTDLAPQR
jgi:uncharacterized MAPEG superfamily protein